MNRKLIRPSLGGRAPGAPAAVRRSASPESTHAEAGYLQQAVESKAPFVALALGGEEFRGRLEGYDRDVLILGRDGRQALILRKERLRCWWLEKPAAKDAAG